MPDTKLTYTIKIPTTDRSEAGVQDSWAKQRIILDVINDRGLTDDDYTRTSKDGSANFVFFNLKDFSAAKSALAQANRDADAEAGISRYDHLHLELQ